MINYSEDYIIPLICRLNGSVSVRASFFAVPAACFAWLLVYLDDLDGNIRKSDTTGLLEIKSSQLWTASTAVLGILLGFRTNRAMARFWEGTGLLHQMRGEWFDSVSCCVTFSRAAIFQKKNDVMKFRHTIVRLMSLCHGSALEEIAGSDHEECETIDSFGLDNRTLQHLKECKETHHFNRVEVLLHLIQSLITKNLDDGVLKIPPPILSRVYQTLSRGFVNLLNAKKIADTRFPFPYVQLITMLLVLHVGLTPIMISAILRSKIWAPIFTFVPIFGMFSLNFIGVELENPFGNDANDLPLDHFQAEMNKCLMMLLEDNADLIAGVSPTRCLTKFADIKTGMRPSNCHSAVHPQSGIGMGQVENRRLSQFSEYVDITADEEDDDDSKMNQDIKARLSFTNQRKSNTPLILDKKIGQTTSPEPGSMTPVAARVSSPPASTPPAAPNALPEVASMPREAISKSMTEFNTALQDLKRSTESQANDLARSIRAVKDFSNTLPVLLESLSSMQPARDKALFQLNDVPMSPATPTSMTSGIDLLRPPPGSSNKPTLPGPMASGAISPVQVDPLDCPSNV